jgi:protein-tyrosine-phosphatase
LSGHIASMLTTDMIQKADLILVMTEHHQGAVIHLVPDAVDKIRILHMEDPYGQSLDVYRACALQLTADLDALLSDIEKEGRW